jgi:hypothetical protein
MKAFALVLLFALPTHAFSLWEEEAQYLVNCRAENQTVYFELWNGKVNYEIKNLSFKSGNSVVPATAIVEVVTPSQDPNSFTSFSKLQARLATGEVLELSSTNTDYYHLGIQDKAGNLVSEYQCSVGQSKGGVIISN